MKKFILYLSLAAILILALITSLTFIQFKDELIIVPILLILMNLKLAYELLKELND